MNQNSYSLIENGKAGLSLERLIGLATILKVDLNFFYEVDSPDTKSERIKYLETMVNRLETRNKKLEQYIIKVESLNNAG